MIFLSNTTQKTLLTLLVGHDEGAGDVDEDGAEVKCTTSPCVPKYRRTQRDNNEKKEEVEKLNAENHNVHSVRTLSASGCLLSGNVKIIINAIVHGHSTSLERA